MTLAFAALESVSPTEEGALKLDAENADTVGRYHDGTFSHGQQSLFIHNGLRFYDGSLPHGRWGGKSVRGVRHDRLARHDGQAVHRLWGWLDGSAYAPTITYQTFSDLCGATASLAVEDALAMEEAAGLSLRRYLLRRGLVFHDGTEKHGFREDQYAL